MNTNIDNYPIARNSFPVILDLENNVYFELTTRQFYNVDINDLVHSSSKCSNYLLIPPNSTIYTLEQLNLTEDNIVVSNQDFVLNIDEIVSDIKCFNSYLFEKENFEKSNISTVISPLIRIDNDKLVKSNSINALVLENNQLKSQVVFNYWLATASLILLVGYMVASNCLPILHYHS